MTTPVTSDVCSVAIEITVFAAFWAGDHIGLPLQQDRARDAHLAILDG